MTKWKHAHTTDAWIIKTWKRCLKYWSWNTKLTLFPLAVAQNYQIRELDQWQSKGPRAALAGLRPLGSFNAALDSTVGTISSLLADEKRKLACLFSKRLQDFSKPTSLKRWSIFPTACRLIFTSIMTFQHYSKGLRSWSMVGKFQQSLAKPLGPPFHEQPLLLQHKAKKCMSLGNHYRSSSLG